MCTNCIGERDCDSDICANVIVFFTRRKILLTGVLVLIVFLREENEIVNVYQFQTFSSDREVIVTVFLQVEYKIMHFFRKSI